MLSETLSEVGISEEALAEAGTMIPLIKEVAVVEHLARLSDNPLFPLRLGLTSQANTGSVLSYILFSSPDLRTGLTHIGTFVQLTRPRSKIEIIASDTSLEFRMAHPDPKVQAAYAYREFVLGNILHSWAAATQTTLLPERVCIAAPLGSRAKSLAKELRCPVEDAKGHTAIVLRDDTLSLPISTNDAQLLQHLTDYGQMLLKKRRPQAASARDLLFNYLMRQLPAGLPSLSVAATELGMSERTLSRRLAEEGTTYRAALDQTRATMAAALLDDPSLSLTEISYLLGFSDQSSFSSAYRRWTGRAPSRDRRPRRVSA